jgi:YidC/Oxa1 family membrane protein insertase
MYDRKTWVSPHRFAAAAGRQPLLFRQDPACQAAERQRELARCRNPPRGGSGTRIETTAELTVETPPPPTEEELVVLKTTRFPSPSPTSAAASSSPSFKNEFDVGSKTSRVRATASAPVRSARSPVAGETLKTSPTPTRRRNPSKAGRRFTSPNCHPAGRQEDLHAQQGRRAGADYLMDFDLQIENATAAALNLNQWSVFLGEASPLYQAEWPQQTGFFWREDGRSISPMAAPSRAACSAPPNPSSTARKERPPIRRRHQPVLRHRAAPEGTRWTPRFGRRAIKSPAGGPRPISVRAGLRLPSGTQTRRTQVV